MCFRWLKRLYHYLRRKCSRRNRGYSREISLSHGGFCSGSFSSARGRASFTCGREGSLTFGTRAAPCPPPPTPYSISGGFSCDTRGSLVVSRDCGVTPGWDVPLGTIPVYGPGVGMGRGGEGVGPALGGTGGFGGSLYPPGDLGTAEGVGYGYSAPLSAGGVTEGYHGVGFGVPGSCEQVMQQKCPVVVPPVKGQQCQQSPQWPPLIQKK